jgi:hypothetical protein
MSDDLDIKPPAVTRNLMGVVCAMLDSFGYNYLELDDATIHLAVGNPRGTYQIYFTATDATDFVRIICQFGSRIPVDRRSSVAEALNRINWKTGIGSFEMDMSDGELRYRIGMDVEAGLFSEKMADNMLGFSLHMMEKYHEPLMRIAFGDADPETAIVEVP